MLCSSSVFKALLLAVRGCSRNESVFCLAPPTDLHSAVRGVRKPLFFFALMRRAWIPCPIAVLHISWTVHEQAIWQDCWVNCTVHTQSKHAPHLFKAHFTPILTCSSCLTAFPFLGLGCPAAATWIICTSVELYGLKQVWMSFPPRDITWCTRPFYIQQSSVKTC